MSKMLYCTDVVINKTVITLPEANLIILPCVPHGKPFPCSISKDNGLPPQYVIVIYQEILFQSPTCQIGFKLDKLPCKWLRPKVTDEKQL